MGKDRFRFLHAADIHLDSPLIGLERYESAPVEAVRGATRRAFENLVRLAIEEQVAFLLLAGDLYDGDWKDFSTGLFFVAQMTKLRDAGIPVFVVAGNHDAASQLTKSLRAPDNVHTLFHKKPETRLVEAYNVAIHGQGFASQAVTEDISAAYPVADPGLFISDSFTPAWTDARDTRPTRRRRRRFSRKKATIIGRWVMSTNERLCRARASRWTSIRARSPPPTRWWIDSAVKLIALRSWHRTWMNGRVSVRRSRRPMSILNIEKKIAGP